MIVDQDSRQEAIRRVATWVETVQRAGHLQFDLIRVVPEIVTNIVNHGRTGSLLLCIWPLGQVELLWCNRVRTGDAVFEGTTPRVAASRLFHAETGSGLSFVIDDLLPRYKGTLAINFKGADIVVHAQRRIEVFHPDKRGEELIPDSVLFTLHMFSRDADWKGKKDGSGSVA